MAERTPKNGKLDDHIEGQDSLPPRTDYGLTNDDGFEPSKYDFYNSAYQTTSRAFVVRLDEYAESLAQIGKLGAQIPAGMTQRHPRKRTTPLNCQTLLMWTLLLHYRR